MTVIYDMRTVGPVDREYVLFNTNIIIFFIMTSFFIFIMSHSDRAAAEEFCFKYNAIKLAIKPQKK